MRDEIIPDSEYSPKYFLMRSLNRANVSIYTGARVVEIADDRVIIDHEGAVKEIPADTVIVAAGAKPFNELAQHVEGMVPETIVVGDALCARNGYHDIAEAYAAALKI
jgi:NADH dehydrogenase FAD-containing subunit